MQGIRVSGSGTTKEPWLHLDWMLRAAIRPLDQCWWYLNGAGCRLNTPEMPKDFQTRSPDDPEMKKWHEESATIDLEYRTWVDYKAEYMVGLPGWFGRYGGAIDGDWALYFAVDHNDGEPPWSIMDQLHPLHRQGRWFDDVSTWPLPREVCLVTRCIDNAYWDLFFRDEWMLGAVRDDLSRRDAVNVQPFAVLSDSVTKPSKKKRRKQPRPPRW